MEVMVLQYDLRLPVDKTTCRMILNRGHNTGNMPMEFQCTALPKLHEVRPFARSVMVGPITDRAGRRLQILKESRMSSHILMIGCESKA